MSVPNDLMYTKSHEWVKIMADGRAKMGITDHAQQAMGDLVYVELPQVGDLFEEGDNLAVVESVKATSDVFAPVGGKVVEINEEVVQSPEIINEDCYEAWFVELETIGEMNLLTPAEYEEVLEEEE